MLIYTWLTRKKFLEQVIVFNKKILARNQLVKPGAAHTHENDKVTDVSKGISCRLLLLLLLFLPFFSFFTLSFTLTVGSSNLLLDLKLDFGTSEAFPDRDVDVTIGNAGQSWERLTSDADDKLDESRH